MRLVCRHNTLKEIRRNNSSVGQNRIELQEHPKGGKKKGKVKARR
jgi:hypothetical protein